MMIFYYYIPMYDERRRPRRGAAAADRYLIQKNLLACRASERPLRQVRMALLSIIIVNNRLDEHEWIHISRMTCLKT
jgi:hypothetical protein